MPEVRSSDVDDDRLCFAAYTLRHMYRMAAPSHHAHIKGMALPRTLIDPKLIYLEPAVRDHRRGREVLARFPDAELVEVASHWKIPQLSDPALTEDWLRVKRKILVLGVKKG